MFYNRQILASNNKTKKLWNIIKTETNRTVKTEDIFCFSSDNVTIFQIPSTNYFLSIADKITLNKKIVIIIINTKTQMPYIIYHNYLVIHY